MQLGILPMITPLFSLAEEAAYFGAKGLSKLNVMKNILAEAL